MPIRLIPCNFFVLQHRFVCYILMFVNNCLFLYLSNGALMTIGFIPHNLL